MLHFTVRRLASACLALGLLGAMSAVALADTLTPSQTAVTVYTTAPDDSVVVNVTLVADALVFTHPGCDVQGGPMQIHVDFTVDNANASASPTSHLYTACGESVPVTITGVSAGTSVLTAAADLTHADTRLPDDPHGGEGPSVGFNAATVNITISDHNGGGDDCDDPDYAAANPVECGPCPNGNDGSSADCPISFADYWRHAPAITNTIVPTTPATQKKYTGDCLGWNTSAKKADWHGRLLSYVGGSFGAWHNVTTDPATWVIGGLYYASANDAIQAQLEATWGVDGEAQYVADVVDWVDGNPTGDDIDGDLCVSTTAAPTSPMSFSDLAQ